jgi:hypothetical protein
VHPDDLTLDHDHGEDVVLWVHRADGRHTLVPGVHSAHFTLHRDGVVEQHVSMPGWRRPGTELGLELGPGPGADQQVVQFIQRYPDPLPRAVPPGQPTW